MNTDHVESEPGAGAAPSLDWARLLAEHAPWMRSVVTARLGEPQAVDEVLQEIALAAVAQRSPLLDRALVGPWLYRLVVVHAFRYRRSQARQRNRLRVYQQRWVARDGEGVTDGGNANPLQLLLRSERRELTAEALRQLPPRDAEILMLKYGERWSYSRIAEYLGIRITSVESRLHRARERLRAALHDRLGD